MRPAGLDNANFWIIKMRDCLEQEIGVGNKISIENGDEITHCPVESIRQCTSFETHPFRATNQLNIDPLGLVLSYFTST